MTIPNFTSKEDATEWMIKKFEEILQSIENAKTHEEKARLMREFDMTQFNAEEQILGDKQVKDYQEYQKAKSLVYDFFDWIEKTKSINIFKVSHSSPFFNEMQGGKTLVIAMLIQLLQQLPMELQAYFILNTFRTTYELNFKNMAFNHS